MSALEVGFILSGRSACCALAEESNHILVGPPDIFYHALANASLVWSLRLGVKVSLECGDLTLMAGAVLFGGHGRFLSLKSFCFLVFDDCDRALRGDATLSWNGFLLAALAPFPCTRPQGWPASVTMYFTLSAARPRPRSALPGLRQTLPRRGQGTLGALLRS